MSLPATDNFDGGDNGEALATYNANWTVNAGAFTISKPAADGSVYPSSGSAVDCLAHDNANTYDNDQYSQAVAETQDGIKNGPAVRVASSDETAYSYRQSNITAYLYKTVTGTDTWKAQVTLACAAGDLLYLQISGTTLSAKHAGADVFGNITDASIASGSAGIYGDAWGGSTHSKLDDWEGGNLGGGATELTVAGLSHSHAAGAPVLTQAHLLALANLAHGHSLGAVALTQAHLLALADLAHAHSLGAVLLTQAHTLAVGGLVHAQALDAPVLTQAHTLAVGSLTHANTLDALALTQAHALIVQSLGHAQSLDGLDLDLSVMLAVANLGHAQGLDAIALTQAHILVVDALGHAQLLDAVVFGAPPAGTVPVRYVVGVTANVVPVETVLVAAAGVIPVREFVGPANVVPVREAPAEWPRVLVRKV